MENTYQRNIALSEATDLERVEFYKKTYSHVAGGVLLFMLAEYIFLNSETITTFMMSMTKGWRWMIMLGGFMLISYSAQSTVFKSTNKQVQYLAFAVYVIAEALIFVPLLFVARSMTNSVDLIHQAAIITLTLFIGLSAIVFITKKDFSFLRGAITLGGFIALGVIAAGMMFGFNLGLAFSVAMCVLAGGSILYETSELVHEYETDEYVAAALSLFSSLMLLFWYILDIVMSFNED